MKKFLDYLEGLLIVIIIILIIYIFYNGYDFVIIKSGEEKLKNLSDWNIGYLNLCITFFTTSISCIVAYLAYKLSKQINNRDEMEKEKQKYKAICMIADYLNKIIRFLSMKLFDEPENYTHVSYMKEFIESVYEIKDYILDNQDIEYLRILDNHLNDYCNRENSNGELAIKWLYKDIFDLSIKPSDIKKNIYTNNDISIFLNIQLLVILAKLNNKLGKRNHSKKGEILGISMTTNINNGKLEVRKQYDSTHFQLNGNGHVERHEPIFFATKPITFNDGNIIYDGTISNYKYNGRGTYYYYSKDTGKGDINSNGLIEENARKYTKFLINNNESTQIASAIKANFTNGIYDDKFAIEKNKYVNDNETKSE